MIRILEKHVADKIAAGEVIDRPVSIVKELVENSLDSGATSIVVEIRGGGREYIRVTDNGCGISEDDAEIAFRRHATSKISTEKDLDSIETLGFRGEALASICAVSRVEMITRRSEDKTGRHLTAESSSILSNDPTGCPAGTTITVTDLFYNVPARLKFLASDSAESRRIIDMMSRIALSYPDVRFRLINGKNEVFTTSGKGNILENILRIYGSDLKDGLLPIDSTMNGCVLKGFVSVPSLTSSSRNRQFFCVNGRVVSSKTVERGLEKAYKQRIITGRFPLAFLFLSVPADTIDVNVHPTKKEIRFDDPFIIEDFIETAVRKSLSGEESIPSAVDIVQNRVVKNESVNYIEKEKKDTPVDVKNLLETMRNDVKDEQMDFISSTPSENVENKGNIDIMNLNVIGVGLDTYIIATDGSSLFLIDQHAAHERILFERLLNQYSAADKASQTLLIPIQITVSADLQSSEDMWVDHVREMGYEIEPFGDRLYIVREVPAFLDESKGEEFLRKFFIELEEKPDIHDFASFERIVMRSCKSAVKGGDRLHQDEIESLLHQLSQCENPYSCPHGRPVLVKLTRYDLEKMFKRT